MRFHIVVFALLLFTISCGNAQDRTNSDSSSALYDNITVTEFNQTFLDAGADTVILDVRTQEEVDAGIIPGAIHIDVLKSDFKEKASQLDKTKTYVVYCRSGRRSVNASKIMVNELGFENVKNLEGGYNAWID